MRQVVDLCSQLPMKSDPVPTALKLLIVRNELAGIRPRATDVFKRLGDFCYGCMTEGLGRLQLRRLKCREKISRRKANRNPMTERRP